MLLRAIISRLGAGCIRVLLSIFARMKASTALMGTFPLSPNKQQLAVFELFDAFLAARTEEECFILKGYAGTGKTTVIGAIVRALPALGLKAVLMAPTGRAAKVMGRYAGRSAFTIHKRIYRKKNAMSLDGDFTLAENLSENTLFIVDEASMISDERGDYGRNSLLHDLISYVYNAKNCKLMLVGDTAQLPPVGAVISPALDVRVLKDRYGLNAFAFELTEVVRQQEESGILVNATRVRNLIRDEHFVFPQFSVKGYPDIYQMNGERLVEGLNYAYDKFGVENTMVVCRSNKSANLYNQQIRNRILFREEEITGGDYLMVVKNNYFWNGSEDNGRSFIANGDIVKIRKVRNVQEMYGFRFADVVLEFTDYPNEEPLYCKILLDSIYVDAPDISRDTQQLLFEEVMKDYEHIPQRKKRIDLLRENEYYNALRVKFAYAITCHKAQGGQWDAVFVDQGFLTDDMVNLDFLRWLYTALTRSVRELFLVNFHASFFSGHSAEV